MSNDIKINISTTNTTKQKINPLRPIPKRGKMLKTKFHGYKDAI
jgi:hypothetical protein